MTFQQINQLTICRGQEAKRNQFNLGFYSRCSFINDGGLKVRVYDLGYAVQMCDSGPYYNDKIKGFM